MIEQCEETSTWLAGCAEYVSPAEESLLRLMTPDYANDPKRLQKLEAKISGKIFVVKKKLKKIKKKKKKKKKNSQSERLLLRFLAENIESMKSNMQSLGESLFVASQKYDGKLSRMKALLANHHSLMTEVRHLLKSMAKVCDKFIFLLSI